ncbi:colicin E5-related ribonuclease [Pseudomonas sp. WC1]|uniref:colicin E5-related ribonuclease n=1 Tax=Pseudomonas sp. WC1 TaxID=3424772 RepID=UPI003D35661C
MRPACKTGGSQCAGTRFNDPENEYIAKDVSCVVRNDRKDAIVQVSDKNWVAHWD